MADPVIPDVAAEAVAPVSPEILAQRKRVELAAGAVYAIGEMAVRGKEALKVSELMAYLDAEYAKECKVLDGLIASEALGKPMEINGSVLKLAQVSH